MASLLAAACGSESQEVQAEPAPAQQTEQMKAESKYQLCNANATAEARQLFGILSSLYGQKIISGVVANVDWNTKEAENVYEWTGRYPALNVFDFINIHASKDVNKDGWLDYSDLSAVEGWWQQGGLVGCMWHWNVRANNGSDMTCSPGTEPGQTSFDASKVDDTGSTEYKQMVHDIDQVAGYLKTMQQKGIPVIWRPLHEAAGNTYDFEDGTMQGWTTIDADGDGFSWDMISAFSGTGHNNSNDGVFSQSYSNTYGALNPDNYFVSPQVTLGGTVTFWACAQDASWAQEHFGLAVSTSGNTNAADFTTLQEWTMTAKGTGTPTNVTRDGSRVQGTWYEYTVDLSTYAGQTGYVAIRHFNCSDWFYLDVDDITIGSSKGNRSFDYTFDDGLQGWTPVDADGDGLGWNHSSQSTTYSGYDYTGYAHNGSAGFVYSQSYIDYDGPYDADNYLISPQMYALQNGSNITFWADNANDSYPDSFGVYVATAANPAPSDFTMVWQGNAKTNGNKAAVRHIDNRFSNWRQHTVDLSAYAGQTVWIAFRHNDYDEYEIWIDDVTINAEGGDDPTPPDDPNPPTPGANVIGVEIFRDGEWIAEVAAPAQTYTDVNPGEVAEYEIRVVYSGQMEDYSHYTMSCPQIAIVPDNTCLAPENLTGSYEYINGNNFGALINWTYAGEVNADWYQYDNNTYATSVGAGGPFQWGVMFPGGSYTGNTVTKVSTVDYLSNAAVMNGSVSIWTGGSNAPQTQLASMPVVFTGSQEEMLYTFDEPVVVDPTQNLWVIFSNDDCSGYAAAADTDTGDPNGRWVGIDGDWYDLATVGLPGYNWIIHCYISDAMSFNLYRNNEVIATIPYSGENMTYFDEAPIGNYQYQVTAVTANCESDFALTPDLSQDYVEINVTSVNEVNDTRIYPNPTTGNVTIEAAGMNHITVVNTLGQVLYDANVDGDSYSMNLGQFKAGVYMLRITTEEGVSVSRVTVTK